VRCPHCGVENQDDARFCARCGRQIGDGDPSIDARGFSTESMWSEGRLDVVLEATGHQKIQLIKVVRELTGLGLKEAKDLVESTPAIVVRNLAAADAAEARDRLAAVGATARTAPTSTHPTDPPGQLPSIARSSGCGSAVLGVAAIGILGALLYTLVREGARRRSPQE
jgi:hypothetical protein